MTATATETRTVSFTYWVSATDAADPDRWRPKYNDAVSRYGFVEVAPPVLLAAPGGGCNAFGLVKAGPTR